MPAKPPRKRQAGETSRARRLRRDQTDVEKLLWSRLRARQLEGCKFVRQIPLGPYIVDFVCRDAGLVIELDGGQHAARVEHDRTRTENLERMGYRVIRFWNNDVLSNIEGVLETIVLELGAAPSPRGGEGEV